MLCINRTPSLTVNHSLKANSRNDSGKDLLVHLNPVFGPTRNQPRKIRQWSWVLLATNVEQPLDSPTTNISPKAAHEDICKRQVILRLGCLRKLQRPGCTWHGVDNSSGKLPRQSQDGFLYTFNISFKRYPSFNIYQSRDEEPGS